MKPDIHELNIAAEVGKLDDVLAFVEALLEDTGCLPKARMQIAIALEELFINIAHYAYPDGKGSVRLLACVTPEAAEITLIDSGIPYDPLKKPDPDVTLSAKERAIGGLGIFMSKKLMDNISYEYKDGKNHLTIKKLLH